MYSVVLVSLGMKKVSMVVFMLVNSPITGGEGEEGVVEQAQLTGAQCTTYLLIARQPSSAGGVHDTHVELG